MKQATAQKILLQTKETYDSIASDFNATRGYLWPGFDTFLAYVPKNSQVLDVGCGNGRLLKLFAQHPVEYTGVDSSEQLIELAKINQPAGRFVVGDVLQLPFPDAQFDVIFMIAVLHHIPSRVLRERVLREIWRVLKPGGTFIMTNWDRYNLKYARYLIRYTVLKLVGRSGLDFKDVFLPWGNSGLTRYYHCFTSAELRRAVTTAGFALEEMYYTAKGEHDVNRNLVVIARKSYYLGR